MKRNIRSITASATHIYVAENNGIRKITIADGTDVSLATGEDFVALCYGNTTLYAATRDSIYTVHVTTGVLTLKGRRTAVDSMAYVSADLLAVTSGNAGMTFVPSTGVFTYKSQTL